MPVPDGHAVTLFSYANTGHAQTNNELRMRFVANLAAGRIDALLLTYEGVREIGGHGWVQPLDEMLAYLTRIDPALAEEMAARVWDISTDDVRGEVLSLEGAMLLYVWGFDAEDLYLSIGANATRMYRVAYLVQALFTEPSWWEAYMENAAYEAAYG